MDGNEEFGDEQSDFVGVWCSINPDFLDGDVQFESREVFTQGEKVVEETFEGTEGAGLVTEEHEEDTEFFLTISEYEGFEDGDTLVELSICSFEDFSANKSALKEFDGLGEVGVEGVLLGDSVRFTYSIGRAFFLLKTTKWFGLKSLSAFGTEV